MPKGCALPESTFHRDDITQTAGTRRDGVSGGGVGSPQEWSARTQPATPARLSVQTFKAAGRARRVTTAWSWIRCGPVVLRC
jgi:hypothetical protein